MALFNSTAESKEMKKTPKHGNWKQAGDWQMVGRQKGSEGHFISFLFSFFLFSKEYFLEWEKNHENQKISVFII